MKRTATVALAAVALAACHDRSPVGPDAAAPQVSASTRAARTVFVTTSADAGAGSLRAAIETASTDASVGTVEFRNAVRAIALQQTVEFTGAQDLVIRGSRVIIDASAAGDDALRFVGGGNLEISRLTVINAPQEGIDIEVPTGATGTVSVTLTDVTVRDNKGHGVLVNDQDVPDAPADGSQPVSTGSDASVHVTAIDARFERNGFSVSDRDGLRVNEGGPGNLTLTLRRSEAIGNAADGVEIDERGIGDARIEIVNSHFTGNGSLDPDDFDDGFDIDEYDAGSILGTVVRSSASNNFEEGFDFNENNAGDLLVDMRNVEANGNREEGIDFEEDDDFAGGGSLVTTLELVTTNGNGADGGDGGLKIREKGAGDLFADVDRVTSLNNVIPGVSVREDAAGNLTSTVRRATVLRNTGNGIDFDENSTGVLTSVVSRSDVSSNTAFGVRADQQATGTGTLQLASVTLIGNVSGTTTGTGVTVSITR